MLIAMETRRTRWLTLRPPPGPTAAPAGARQLAAAAAAEEGSSLSPAAALCPLPLSLTSLTPPKCVSRSFTFSGVVSVGSASPASAPLPAPLDDPTCDVVMTGGECMRGVGGGAAVGFTSGCAVGAIRRATPMRFAEPFLKAVAQFLQEDKMKGAPKLSKCFIIACLKVVQPKLPKCRLAADCQSLLAFQLKRTVVFQTQLSIR